MVQQMMKFSSGLEVELRSYSEIDRDKLLQEIQDKNYDITTNEWEILIDLFD